MGNYETWPNSVVAWVCDWNGAEVCYDGCAEDARLFCAGLKLIGGLFLFIEGTATTLQQPSMSRPWPSGSHFAQDNAPLLNIPGRTHPVEIFYTSEPERDAVSPGAMLGASVLFSVVRMVDKCDKCS